MKAIILAADQASGPHPMPLNRPRALLEVAHRPMIEHTLENLNPVEELNRIYIVTHQRFAAQFERWAERYRQSHPDRDIQIVNDGSDGESNSLGALGDLNLVLTSEGIDDDILVMAGDNLFSVNLREFVTFGRLKNAPTLATYDVGNIRHLNEFNSIKTDAQGRITFFEEKSSNPASTTTAVGLYYYPQSSLPLIRRYVEEGNRLGRPGRLVQWMYARTPFFAWDMPGTWYDISSMETLEEANRVFSRR